MPSLSISARSRSTSDCPWSATGRRRRWEFAPARKHNACTASDICWRPAERRTRAVGMVMRATAMVRTKSSDRDLRLCQRRAFHLTRLLIGTLSGYGSMLASCATSPARCVRSHPCPRCRRCTRACRLAYTLQGIEPVLIIAGADDVPIEFRRGIEVVVVIVQSRSAQLLGLLVVEHAQRGTGFQAETAHPPSPSPPRQPCLLWKVRATPPPCRSDPHPRPASLGRFHHFAHIQHLPVLHASGVKADCGQ